MRSLRRARSISNLQRGIAKAGRPLCIDWPLCQSTEEMCLGKALDSSLCLKHMSVGAREAWLRGLRPGSDVELPGTAIDSDLFQRIVDRLSTKGNTSFGTATFDMARLSNCSFSSARFSGTASFNLTKFVDDSGQFAGSQFLKEAWFYGSTFASDASFAGARFEDVTNFDRVQFIRDADFAGCRFSGDLTIENALVSGYLMLDRAVLETRTLITAAAEGFSALRTVFKGGAEIRLGGSFVFLESTDFGRPSLVAAVPDTFREPTLRVDGFPSCQLNVCRPSLMSLRQTDVANLELINVDLKSCRFAEANNLDHLTIRGLQTFANVPPMQRALRWPLFWHYSPRQTLAEEHHWRSTPGWKTAYPNRPEPLSIRGWTKFERFYGRKGWPWSAEPEELTAERVAELYRLLRKAREDSKDEPGAADFYFGEMEMRRRADSTPRMEKFILWIYWLVSGYGLRGSRALVALLLTLSLFNGLFLWNGFAHPSEPFQASTRSTTETLSAGSKSASPIKELKARVLEALTTLDAWSYTAGAAVNLSSDAELQPWGRFYRLVIRMLGPLFLGLAILSVRNRVKR